MVKPVPALVITEPRLTALELLCLARPLSPKGESAQFIRESGVELNGNEITDPAKKLVVKTGDIFRVARHEWFRIEVVRVNNRDVKLNDLETDRMMLKPLRVQDVDKLKKFLPEWEVAKYLSTPLSAKKALSDKAAPPERAAAEDDKPKGKEKGGKATPAVALKSLLPEVTETGAPTTAISQQVARDVLKRVIMQPEPKTEWLWKILPKQEPEKIIGVAHLRTENDGGSQNIWLTPELQDENLMSEAMAAVNEHAFTQLGFKNMAFDQAFAFAAQGQEMEVLRRRFNNLDAASRSRDVPLGVWGLTREGWDKMKGTLRPGQSRSQRVEREKKDADEKQHVKRQADQKKRDAAADDVKKETAKKASKKRELPSPKPEKKS